MRCACALYLMLCPVPSSVPCSLLCSLPRPVPSSVPYPCALSSAPSCIPCVFGSSVLRIERPPPFSGNTLSYAAAAVLPGVSSFSSAHNQPCPPAPAPSRTVDVARQRINDVATDGHQNKCWVPCLCFCCCCSCCCLSFHFVSLRCPPSPPLAHSLLSFLFDAKFVFFSSSSPFALIFPVALLVVI